MREPVSDANEMFEQAIAVCGPAIRRLAAGYEADPDRRRDLVQEIHLELWRSLRLFDGRCSLKTWTYRVAHNVGASHVWNRRRATAQLVDLEALSAEPVAVYGQAEADQKQKVATLLEQIHRLKPFDRQIMLLYLEGESAESIAETTGTAPGNVAGRIHRIKKLLASRLSHGGARARG